ncbi:hypothetical protein CROQUDRAFT_49188 [Cronartium quercuum f. sp. fusiforme G11]|uniref:Glucanase n=1 Tax=Cronartium quercuum f. sp. fusiforme G11 TaxID=708437 RepID=A0A9P6NAW4_9BASI|nr:hypothetical protein CROQUDRAFT_49188 [Cronartium quercuum f. sp. fusiforme G11]
MYLVLIAHACGCQYHNPVEVQPKMGYESCTKDGCQKHEGTLTVDASLRRIQSLHNPSLSCFDKGAWDQRLCSDAVQCTKNCAIQGVLDYNTVGVSSVGQGVRIRLVTEDKKTKSKTIGSRLYQLDSDGNYLMYKLKGKEFAFEVDVSRLPCGVNGALYFSEMAVDGGSRAFLGTNHSGAFFGTGYCDAQSPSDLMYFGAEANVGLKRKRNKSTSYGYACAEMDLFEANSLAQQFVPHPCRTATKGPFICHDKQCGASPDGLCDKSGCSFASYQLGEPNYFGPGKMVDTNFPFTVVTQFINDTSGSLAEIRRLYVQNGTVIENSRSGIPGMTEFDSITDRFCTASSEVMGSKEGFKAAGGLKAMGESLERGMVLVMSLWTDHSDNDMLWLDGHFPLNASSSRPGVVRGPCTPSEGDATVVENKYPDAFVQFSNLRFGELDTTYLRRDPQHLSH